MTRNLYLGADLGPALAATSQEALAIAAASIYRTVQQTDFPSRARAIAKEIAAAEPMVVGLQEATLWRTGQPGVLDGPVTPATTVGYDFLAILDGELHRAGLRYELAVVHQNVDIEVPSALGFDVRYTDRDAILVRADSGETAVVGATSGQFATLLSVPVLGQPLPLLRSWTSVDVRVNQQPVRVINVHLEPFSATHRSGQASELIAASGPADTPGGVVLIGDFNSTPGSTGDAYPLLTGAGYIDAWSTADPGDAGNTCCQQADLTNPTSQLGQRLDLVLVRSGSASKVQLYGDDPRDRTPAGLWPSDHAGVFAKVRP
jgi:endonuclease/exonuclease/phosphatase family metal-dependent hydrolase